MRVLNSPPKTEAELLLRASEVEGLNVRQVANLLQITIPEQASQRKGFIGQALEKVLGASAGSQALPDFPHLGIELKTLPLGPKGSPVESTFITTIDLLSIHRETWKSSPCYQKLKRVLWLPIEGDRKIPFEERRIGRAKLWSPNAEQEKALAADWQELSNMIGHGQLELIDASMGEYLQVRPKGMNARSLCYGFNEAGERILTLPRGFYLRARFTRTIISQF